jgi:hypothetical protein
MVDMQREGLEQMRVGPGIGVSPGVKERVVQLLFLLLDQPQSVFLVFFFVAGECSHFPLLESPSEFLVVFFLVAGESSRLGMLLGIYTEGMSRYSIVFPPSQNK